MFGLISLDSQLQADMISLNASFIGGLAPPPKQTLPGGEGKTAEVPFAKMSRLDKLRASGKYEGAENDEENGVIDDDNAEIPSPTKVRTSVRLIF